MIGFSLFKSSRKGGMIMKKSILKGKRILAVEDNPHILAVLQEEIREACPDCFFDKAMTYKEADERMAMFTYDLVILDGIGACGFDLFKNAVVRNYPAVILTDPTLSSEMLRRYSEMGARACLPKEKIEEIVSFLEDVFRYGKIPGRRRLFKKLEVFLPEFLQIGERNPASISGPR
jgi:CheY-like chemotaxis protein